MLEHSLVDNIIQYHDHDVIPSLKQVIPSLKHKRGVLYGKLQSFSLLLSELMSLTPEAPASEALNKGSPESATIPANAKSLPV